MRFPQQVECDTEFLACVTQQIPLVSNALGTCFEKPHVPPACPLCRTSRLPGAPLVEPPCELWPAHSAYNVVDHGGRDGGCGSDTHLRPAACRLGRGQAPRPRGPAGQVPSPRGLREPRRPRARWPWPRARTARRQHRCLTAMLESHPPSTNVVVMNAGRLAPRARRSQHQRCGPNNMRSFLGT